MRLEKLNRRGELLSGLLLGVFSLGLNGICELWGAGDNDFGNIFLFIAALSSGLRGTLTSLAVGALPMGATFGDPIACLRVTIVVLGLAYGSERHPRLPGFLIVTFLWICLFGPLSILLQPAAEIAPIKAFSLNAGFTDVFFALVSGSLLLNASLAYALPSPRKPLGAVGESMHLCSLVGVLVAFFAMVTPTSPSGLPLLPMPPNNWENLFQMFGIVIALPSLLGACMTLHSRFRLGTDEVFALGLGEKIPEFSGFYRLTSRLRHGRMTDDPDEELQNTREFIGRAQVNERIPDDAGVCAIDDEGIVLFANKRFAQLLRIPHQGIISASFHELPIPKTLSVHFQTLREHAIPGGRRVTEIRLQDSPLHSRFLELSSLRGASLHFRDEGPRKHIVLFWVRDITERRTVEGHLLRAKKLDSLATLVRSVGHAFNNTLTTISGNASYAQLLARDPKLNGALKEIVSSARNVSDVLHKVVDFASDRPALVKTADFSAFIEEGLPLLQRLVGLNTSIEFENPQKLVPVHFDPDLLTQVIINLALNSKESYREGFGRILISLDVEVLEEEASFLQNGARPGSFARLRVKDFGCGMPPEVLALAFDPLFTTKSSQGHTGLGLSIVFSVVRAHDGFLTAESHPEKGTTLSLYFPLSELPMVDLASRATMPDITSKHCTPGQTGRILVVEDEAPVREVVTDMLSHLGYEVESCTDALEALKRSENREFDLIIVDMLLPVMNGLTLISKLQEKNQCKRFLIMTGQKDHPEALIGDTPVLLKPFEFETLAEIVGKSFR